MWPPTATRSSGWLRDAVVAVPVPPGWKLWCSVVPKAICLTVSVPLGALGLALGALEVELELEHPATASRPAATTMVPSPVAVRRLKMFTDHVYALRVTDGTVELDEQMNDPCRESD